MTLKRALLIAVVGFVVAVGVANAGWFYQSGRWFYTPDIGTEITYKGVPLPQGADKPPQVVWTLQTTEYACACRNNGGNFASQVVSVVSVTLTAVDDLPPGDFIDKKKGIARATGHIDTDSLCSEPLVQCQNDNWTPDPDSALVKAFKGTAEAFVWDKQLEQYVAVAGSKQTFENCTLADPSASPLNLPAAGTPYNCD